MRIARAINNLIEAFERLPGIGPKSAARLTYYLLHVPQKELDKFADSVKNLKLNNLEYDICHNISEEDPCDICRDHSRDKNIICVVEQPLDVLAVERSGKYTGLYHVLHGAISPLNNIGPDQLFLHDVTTRLKGVDEVILATNPTMEGEATAMYIQQLIGQSRSDISITRIGHGLPVGADLEYADGVTIARAMEGRRKM